MSRELAVPGRLLELVVPGRVPRVTAEQGRDGMSAGLFAGSAPPGGALLGRRSLLVFELLGGSGVALDGRVRGNGT